MWLFTTDGFFSAVADRDHPGHVVVRTRVREDGERLLAALGAGELLETQEADYRFRVRATREAWVGYVASAAEDIDYDNFKAAVAVRNGAGRARTYGDVWAVMRDLQESSRS